jgi:mRNA-degrading endonuclease RelE of RelBE toxin-antitoxin system
LNFDFNELDIKKLSWTNLYRCRIWKYRIIFDRDNSEIKILKIWNRGDIYKS